MKILVVNAGSSSLKYQLFDMTKGEVLAKGNCERIGIDGFLTHKVPGKEDYKTGAELKNHRSAIELVLKTLTDKELGVIESVEEIGAVGHRFAHGGEKLRQSSVLGDEEIAYLESIVGINPLHGPPAISGLKACKEVMPSVKHVGVFDTSYYSEMQDYAYIYPIPYELYEKYKIRRYGFHGTSHRYVAGVAAGKFECLKVFGNDYDTPDGTGVRDYIHVSDLAVAHIKALEYVRSHKGVEAINLGTGRGYSVLELVEAYGRASGKQIPYKIVKRRDGDVGSCYANADKAARLLGWRAERGIDEMCADMYRWQSMNPDGYK